MLFVDANRMGLARGFGELHRMQNDENSGGWKGLAPCRFCFVLATWHSSSDTNADIGEMHRVAKSGVLTTENCSSRPGHGKRLLRSFSVGKSWLNTIGGLSLGYGVFVGLWAMNVLGGYALNRHENASAVRPSEWTYVAVSIAASLALVAVGVLINRRNSAISRVRAGLTLSDAILILKALVVGWMVASFFRNPTGPLDGLVVALIPLSIAPSVLWAVVQLLAAFQIGKIANGNIQQIRPLLADRHHESLGIDTKKPGCFYWVFSRLKKRNQAWMLKNTRHDSTRILPPAKGRLPKMWKTRATKADSSPARPFDRLWPGTLEGDSLRRVHRQMQLLQEFSLLSPRRSAQGKI